MKVDARAVEPFNTWWRSKNHCEPSPIAVEAFAAGFKAGLERGVKESMDIIRGSTGDASAKP
jgi:hypothetical protein